jgi:hypothetical protein
MPFDRLRVNGKKAIFKAMTFGGAVHRRGRGGRGEEKSRMLNPPMPPKRVRDGFRGNPSSFHSGRTTKDENSSARLNTEILPLHAVQGQNDIKSSAFYFQSNDIWGRGWSST